MVKLTILSHPCTPVAPAELEDWLSERADRLRSSAPLIVHLSQLTQGRNIAAGWLIELEPKDESSPLNHDELLEVLADLLADMRFLGMQPMLLVPHEVSELKKLSVELARTGYRSMARFSITRTSGDPRRATT
jgi:hypothetical protein